MAEPAYATVARLARESYLDSDLLRATDDPRVLQHAAVVQPGSMEEEAALARIDEIRYQELRELEETNVERRDRHRRATRSHLKYAGRLGKW